METQSRDTASYRVETGKNSEAEECSGSDTKARSLKEKREYWIVLRVPIETSILYDYDAIEDT